MTRPRLPWLRMRKKTDPELPLEPPIMLGNKSNGEFFHEQTPRERQIRKTILRMADDNARKLGIDRREFLASAMGMATSLTVLNMASGCGDDGETASGAGAGGSGGGPGDGGYSIPPDAMLDCDEATEAIGGDYFIVDMQTHHLIDEERWRETRPPDMPFPGGSISFDPTCTGRVECTDQHSYVNNIFLNSETSVAVLSGLPAAIMDNDDLITGQISNEDMVQTREWINEAAGSQRVIQHCQVAPNDNWDRQSAMMERIRSQFGNNGWKCYPPWSPTVGASGEMEGWWLDSDVGSQFIQRCIDLGEPIVCAHKGFPFPTWSRTTADPSDVGPTATRFPGVNFVIYHSAYQDALGLGEYPATGPVDGPDRLVRTVMENDLTNKNVFAEMGSCWALVMNVPENAMHYVGKMLKYIGEDRLVWGSECVWFGSPQPQIEAFKALEISQEFQDLYGYPALTPERKAKILGLNAARLYGIDVEATRCTLNTDKLAVKRRELDEEFGGRRWAFQRPFGPRTWREYFNLGRLKAASGEPG